MGSSRPVGALRAVLLASFAGVVLAGCPARRSRGPVDAGTPGSERVLVLGATQEPDSLDPARSETAGAREVQALIHRGLGVYDERWRYTPSLAAGPPQVETSTAGLAVVFELRAGLSWSDGAPLHADDFVYGHAVLTDPETSPRTLSAYQNIARVEAPGPRQLRVRLRDGGLPEHVFALMVALPRHVPRAAKDRGLDRAPLANGPYELLSWRPGEQLELRRRAGWTGPAPWFDRVVFLFLESEDALEAALLSGRVDAVGEASGLSVGKASALEARLRATHRVERAESGVWLQLSLRHDHPLTGELAVRRALNLAIDREALVAVSYEGEATPAGGLFPARHPVGLRPPPARDLEGARRALEAAGFARRGERYEKNGAALELEMSFATGSLASERAASFIAASLGEVPIRVRLRGVPLRVLLELQRSPERAPLALLAWRLPPDWDAAAVVGRGGSKNYGGFVDAEVERALAEARVASSEAAWRAALARLDARAADRLPVLSLAFRRSLSVRPVGLQGWRPTGTITPVTWNAEQWRWDRGSQASDGRRLDAPGGAE